MHPESVSIRLAEMKFALILFIVIDQFRVDQLQRAHPTLISSGIKKIFEQGISYEDAYHTNFFNLTCPGHVALSTGAEPGLSGILLNEDWERVTEKPIYCMEDPAYSWIDADADKDNLAKGSSAKRILTSTITDEIKYVWGDDVRVHAVSVKDRSAITLAGHAGDGAFWFAPQSKVWTTSTAYQKSGKLPEWLKKFNQKYKEKFDGEKHYQVSPRSIEDATNLALEIFKSEKMGHHKGTDFLGISYSAHDTASHHYGDESKELKAVFKKEDEEISRLLKEVQKGLGTKKFLVVLTSDHGGGINHKEIAKLNIPGGAIKRDKLRADVNDCLKEKGFKSKSSAVVHIPSAVSVYLSNDVKDKAEARKQTKECLNQLDEVILEAFTSEEILSGQIPRQPWLRNLASSYNRSRGPDVVGVLRPYWNSDTKLLVAHETPYNYDANVPLVFWWQGAKPKKIYKRVEVTSVAPTLARILKVRKPSGSMSELLSEVIESK